MKIVFFEIRDSEKELLSELLVEHELIFSTDKLTRATVPQAVGADIISIFIDSMVNKEIIDALAGVKLITTRSTGFDHIDAAYAASKEIAVATVPAYGSNTVAEFAFGLILALSRNIAIASDHIREHTDYTLGNLRGFDLFGKTIGIVGTGKIGKNAARIAKGFGMRVIAMDSYPDAAFAAALGVEYVSLSTLLSSADIITIHAPYNETTHHLINKENISLIKKGALFINTARGELVDTEALVAALKSGTIAGAGLDVLEGERALKEEAEFLSRGVGGEKEFKILAEDHALIDMPNVIVTPHIAFFSKEAEDEIAQTTADNIMKFIGGTPQNLVTK